MMTSWQWQTLCITRTLWGESTQNRWLAISKGHICRILVFALLVTWIICRQSICRWFNALVTWQIIVEFIIQLTDLSCSGLQYCSLRFKTNHYQWNLSGNNTFLVKCEGQKCIVVPCNAPKTFPMKNVLKNSQQLKTTNLPFGILLMILKTLLFSIHCFTFKNWFAGGKFWSSLFDL